MSCPADLEPYSKAYMLEQRESDSNMWAWWGTYGLSATLTAIDRALMVIKQEQNTLRNR